MYGIETFWDPKTKRGISKICPSNTIQIKITRIRVMWYSYFSLHKNTISVKNMKRTDGFLRWYYDTVYCSRSFLLINKSKVQIKMTFKCNYNERFVNKNLSHITSSRFCTYIFNPNDSEQKIRYIIYDGQFRLCVWPTRFCLVWIQYKLLILLKVGLTNINSKTKE